MPRIKLVRDDWEERAAALRRKDDEWFSESLRKVLSGEEEVGDIALDPETEVRLDADLRQFVAEQGPTVVEALEQLNTASRREVERIRAEARAEARPRSQEIGGVESIANESPPDDVGDYVMNFTRDKSGRIAGPVILKSASGRPNYEMAFTRDKKSGRIASPVTLKQIKGVAT